MPHYNAYESFQTKKSKEKKQRAIEKSTKKKNNKLENFVIENNDKYGIVVEVRYNDAYILYNEKLVVARLRKDMNIVCNQVLFPGDKVVLNKINNTYLITNLLKRTSLLSRIKKDSTRINGSGLIKNIATNIDMAVIVVAAQEPPLHPKFIDRYLMILQNSNIPAIICLNKCDLKTDAEEKILDIYRKINIPVIETSTYKNTGIDDLKRYILGKQVILVGNSGVGKSSLTNALMNSNEIKTGQVSDKSKRGKHTTTTSKYYIWEKNSSIIDTPGIRSLDISSFNPEEVQEYFKEFNDYKDKCKYHDCLHYNEPSNSCVIKQAVTNGLININRYESYVRIMSDILNDKNYEHIIEELSERN